MFSALCRIILGLVLAASMAAATPAAAEGAKLPRFASFAAAKVHLRQGPSFKNRILWVYHRRGLPVEIVAQYDVWRRIRLPDGTRGWVHSAMLSGRRTVVVTSAGKAAVREGPEAGSKTLALAQPGVIAKLYACQASACEIGVDGIDGWIDKKNVWGVDLSGSKR